MSEKARIFSLLKSTFDISLIIKNQVYPEFSVKKSENT